MHWRVVRRLGHRGKGRRSRRPLVERLESRDLLAFDFGDAPDSTIAWAEPRGYPTRLVDDGARHEAVGPRLGNSRDSEPDGQPSSNAYFDDGNGFDLGANGIEIRILVPGQQATAIVDLQDADSNSNRLDGWIDFNVDGDWNDQGEKALDNLDLGTASGTKALAFTVPPDAHVGDTFARFRLSTSGGLASTGAAADGEVEDYPVSIQKTHQLARWNFDDGGTSPLLFAIDSSGSYRNLSVTAINRTDMRPAATSDSLASLRFPQKGYLSTSSLELRPEDQIDTITFWLRPENYSIDATADPHVVMEFDGDAGPKIVLGSWTTQIENEVISLVMGNDANPVQITSVTNVSRISNQWLHVAFVWSQESNRYEVFLDGIKQSVVTTTTPAHVQRFTADGLRIGSRNASPTFDLHGQLDDVRLFYGSLTEADLEEMAVNLIAQWNFDSSDDTSLVRDANGNGRDLALSGLDSSDWRNGAKPATGDPHSLRFPFQGRGTNANLHIPSEQHIDTIAFWIRPEDFSIDSNADPHIVMELGGDGGVKVVLGSWTLGLENESISLIAGNASVPVQITSVLNARRFANQWTHVAFVWSEVDNRYDVYLDGQKREVASRSDNTHVERISANSIRIGSRNADPGFDLRGQLDDVRLYHGSLTAAEIERFATNLIAHWNFDDKSIPGIVPDASGNGRDVGVSSIADSDWTAPATENARDHYSLRFPYQGHAANETLEIPDDLSIDAISFWIRPDTRIDEAADPRVIMEFGGDDGVKLVMGSWTNRATDEVFSLVVGNAEPLQMTYSTQTISANVWVRVVVTWADDSNRYEIGVIQPHGSSRSFAVPSHVPKIRTNSIRIGGRRTDSKFDLRSELDDVRLYHGNVSASEVWHQMW